MAEKVIPHPEPALPPLSEFQHVLELLEKWQGEPYDGLKGTLPRWVPDQIVVDFAVDQYAVCLAVKNRRLTVFEAYSCLKLYVERQELTRLQDDLFEQHRNDEAFELKERMDNLKLPEPLKLHDEFNRLARTHVDLKLEQNECLKLWLGEDIAWNKLVGEAQRERSSIGGRESGVKRREYAEHDNVVKNAKSLRQSDEARRGLASLLISRGMSSLSVRQINRILKKANIK